MPFDNLPTIIKCSTWSKTRKSVKTDPRYPPHRRADDASRLGKALAWDAAPSWHAAKSPVTQRSKFSDRIFNHKSIEELFDGLCAADLGLEPKTLKNAHRTCNRIADFYEAPRGIGHTPLTDECKRLLSLVPSKWDRRDLRPGLRYHSYISVSPWNATQVTIDDLEKAIFTECRLAAPRATFNAFTRTWNKCAIIPDWPPLVITRNAVQRRSAIDWAEYSELEASIDTYLACGCRLEELEGDEPSDELDIEDDIDDDDDDDGDLTVPLTKFSERNHKSSLGMVVWAFREAGVQHDQLLQPYDLCAPRRFRLAMRGLKARAGGVVSRTVIARFDALGRLAAHPGVLEKADLKLVRRIVAKYEQKHVEFMKTYASRDQEMLDCLDDASVMDTLLALPTVIKNKVLSKRNPNTIG
ncbi:MAG: hypothetical protein ABL901_12735 [Hyphomicrobiaceae bacterium]